MNDEMKEILNDFLAESAEMLEALDQNFVQLESDPNNAELLNEIFRCMHSMKGSAGFLGFTHLVEVAHQGESLLNKLRQGEMAVSPFVIDNYFGSCGRGEDAPGRTFVIPERILMSIPT